MVVGATIPLLEYWFQRFENSGYYYVLQGLSGTVLKASLIR
jgi:hypothetical protein